MHVRTKIAAVLLAAGTTIGLASVSASADVVPSPSDSPSAELLPSHMTPSPTPTPVRVRPRPVAFIVHSNTADPRGTVALFSSISALNGIGTGNFRNGPDTWRFGPRTLTLLHSPVGPLVRDSLLCTARVDQTGRWALVGQRAFAFGQYRLRTVAVLARGIFGQCLTRVVRWQDTQVVGTGQGISLRLHQHQPRLTPSLTPADPSQLADDSAPADVSPTDAVSIDG